MHDISWNTKNEVEFLKGLGRHRNHSAHGQDVRESSRAERLNKLLEYRKAMDLRVEWGKIDRTAIVLECERMIAELQGR